MKSSRLPISQSKHWLLTGWYSCVVSWNTYKQLVN